MINPDNVKSETNYSIFLFYPDALNIYCQKSQFQFSFGARSTQGCDTVTSRWIKDARDTFCSTEPPVFSETILAPSRYIPSPPDSTLCGNSTTRSYLLRTYGNTHAIVTCVWMKSCILSIHMTSCREIKSLCHCGMIYRMYPRCRQGPPRYRTFCKSTFFFLHRTQIKYSSPQLWWAFLFREHSLHRNCTLTKAFKSPVLY